MKKIVIEIEISEIGNWEPQMLQLRRDVESIIYEGLNLSMANIEVDAELIDDDDVNMSPISQYNLAHTELGSDCCGVFNKIIANGIIVCNECEITLHDAVIKKM